MQNKNKEKREQEGRTTAGANYGQRTQNWGWGQSGKSQIKMPLKRVPLDYNAKVEVNIVITQA